MEELKWLAQNADLNLAEHLWVELKYKLHSRSYCPTLVFDLPNVLLAEWEPIPTEMLQNLMGSLPRRGEAVKAVVATYIHFVAKSIETPPFSRT